MAVVLGPVGSGLVLGVAPGMGVAAGIMGVAAGPGVVLVAAVDTGGMPSEGGAVVG